MIHIDDYEMESIKDSVYLLEDIEDLKNQIYPLLHEEPATIVVEENEISKQLQHETKLRTFPLKGIAEKFLDT